MKLHSLLIVAAALSLSGCAFAPGQHLDTQTLLEQSSPESSNVELIPITPKLLAIQQATQETAHVPPELLGYKPGPYRIGPGDTLQVTVWEHPELTIPAGTQQPANANGRTVLPDGSFYFPYVGTIQAAGMTINELRATLTRQLTKWLEKPQVDVTVLTFESAKVQISGAFQKTESQAITRVPLSLIAALGAASINVAEADLSGLTLTREGRKYHLDLDELNRGDSKLDELYLKAGDLVHLPYNDRKKAYVIGEVTIPATITFKTRVIMLSDALGKAGGLRQDTSNGDAVYVIRGVDNIEAQPAQIFHLAAKSPAAFALASRFEVRPQDVVFVGPAGITRWNRLISQLLPSGSLLKTGTDIKNSN